MAFILQSNLLCNYNPFTNKSPNELVGDSLKSIFFNDLLKDKAILLANFLTGLLLSKILFYKLLPEVVFYSSAFSIYL